MGKMQGVITRLARQAVGTLVSGFALLGFAFVPLGQKTGLEHLEAIVGTHEAQEATAGLKQKLQHLKQHLLEAMQRSAASEQKPKALVKLDQPREAPLMRRASNATKPPETPLVDRAANTKPLKTMPPTRTVQGSEPALQGLYTTLLAIPSNAMCIAPPRKQRSTVSATAAVP